MQMSQVPPWICCSFGARLARPATIRAHRTTASSGTLPCPALSMPPCKVVLQSAPPSPHPRLHLHLRMGQKQDAPLPPSGVGLLRTGVTCSPRVSAWSLIPTAPSSVCITAMARPRLHRLPCRPRHRPLLPPCQGPHLRPTLHSGLVSPSSPTCSQCALRPRAFPSSARACALMAPPTTAAGAHRAVVPTSAATAHR